MEIKKRMVEEESEKKKLRNGWTMDIKRTKGTGERTRRILEKSKRRERKRFVY
jgi:hypothetical protein